MGGAGRKARIGKNSVREQQLQMTQPEGNGRTAETIQYSQQMPPHLQHYHHEMMYNANLYAAHYDHQRYGQAAAYLGHIHHLPPPPQQQPQQQHQQQQSLTASHHQQPRSEIQTATHTTSYSLGGLRGGVAEDDNLPMTVIKQEPVIKTERLELKQELVSADEEAASRVVNFASVLREKPGTVLVSEKEGLCESASFVNNSLSNRVDQSAEKVKDPYNDHPERRKSEENQMIPDSKSNCDKSIHKSGKEDQVREDDGDKDELVVPVRSSLLRLSSAVTSSVEGKGPKKSNYKKLIRPAEPKPYLSCTQSGVLRRSDKFRKKMSGGDRVRMQLMMKKRRQRSRQPGQVIVGVVRVVRRGAVKRKNKSSSTGPVKKKTKWKVQNRKAISADGKDLSQDKNNNNMDKEVNNNVETDKPEELRSANNNHLDETIDLVARGHFETVSEDEKGHEDVSVSPPKKRKLDPKQTTLKSKSKSSVNSAKQTLNANKTNASESHPKLEERTAEKKRKAQKKINEKLILKEEEKKKVKLSKKKRVVTSSKLTVEEDHVSNIAVASTPEPVVQKDVTKSNAEVPEKDKAQKTNLPESSFVSTGSIASETLPLKPEVPVEIDPVIKVIADIKESSPVSSVLSEEVRPLKGRPGRKPKRGGGGGGSSRRKRKNQQRLSKALEEVPLKKHVGAPRWSNGWNWLGEAFQGLVFLNVS